MFKTFLVFFTLKLNLQITYRFRLIIYFLYFGPANNRKYEKKGYLNRCLLSHPDVHIQYTKYRIETPHKISILISIDVIYKKHRIQCNKNESYCETVAGNISIE